MKYVTGTLADALLEARRGRSNTSEDFTDVDDRMPEADNEEEVNTELGLEEARWVTMNGNHALIGDKGELLKGGDPKKRVDADKSTIDAAVKDANAKSKDQ